MQVRGRIISQLPLQSGVSKAGNSWEKATVVIETLDQYPKTIAMSNMKRAQELAAIPVGTTAVFDIGIESREYNGRWYTEVTCWGWTVEGAGQSYYQPAPQTYQPQAAYQPSYPSTEQPAYQPVPQPAYQPAPSLQQQFPPQEPQQTQYDPFTPQGNPTF